MQTPQYQTVAPGGAGCESREGPKEVYRFLQWAGVWVAAEEGSAREAVLDGQLFQDFPSGGGHFVPLPYPFPAKEPCRELPPHSIGQCSREAEAGRQLLAASGITTRCLVRSQTRSDAWHKDIFLPRVSLGSGPWSPSLTWHPGPGGGSPSYCPSLSSLGGEVGSDNQRSPSFPCPDRSSQELDCSLQSSGAEQY